jgi:hypothetical protein
MIPRRFLAALILFPTLSLAQTQFSGKWQARTNAAGESTITLNIVVDDSAISGQILFLDSHGEYRMPIINAHAHADILEFETKGDDADIWSWRLALKGTRKGLLHGSIGEMLIDERVKKRH